MQVGDLVIRKCAGNTIWQRNAAWQQRQELGSGIVLSKEMSGSPEHPCLTVYYAKAGRTWDIAESLMEVIND